MDGYSTCRFCPFEAATLPHHPSSGKLGKRRILKIGLKPWAVRLTSMMPLIRNVVRNRRNQHWSQYFKSLGRLSPTSVPKKKIDLE
ncbi:hypothetical protein OUZ56_029850 [Daphnia magna]|uniref:Uncharacterized protein n=1 Tax=Daphnia magna TaxID=35525 RepID=A0ABR0B813_9CRUS|nr:hypothetical protein OUZ56_029850 [Daphnia magna]